MRVDILFYNTALDHAKNGEWKDARRLLKRASELKADGAEYHSLLGVVYLGLKLRRSAVEQLRLAYELDREDPLLQQWLEVLFGSDSGRDDDDPPHSSGSPPILESPLPAIPFCWLLMALMPQKRYRTMGVVKSCNGDWVCVRGCA